MWSLLSLSFALAALCKTPLVLNLSHYLSANSLNYAGMGTEGCRSMLWFLLFFAPMMTAITLMENGMLQYDTRIRLCTLGPAFCTILDVNVLSRRAWGRAQRSNKRGSVVSSLLTVNARSTVKASSVYIVGSGSSEQLQLQQQQSSPSREKFDLCKMVTSLRVLKSPPLTAAFAEYVEKALCYESFKFLVVATGYAHAAYDSTVLQVITTTTVLAGSVDYPYTVTAASE
jgi:hypothetical protein